MTPIRTRLSFSGWKLLIIAIVCLGLSAWGAYDLLATIPRREAAFAAFETAQAKLDALEQERARQLERGRQPTAIDASEYDAAKREFERTMVNGKAPRKPGKWDALTQWFFIACAPFAVPYFIWFARLSRKSYALDETGTLHFTGDAEHGSGSWPVAEIAEIDMSRWMAKSIAFVQHRDANGGGGRKLKLDAYYHKDLDRIIGAIAARLHSDEWTEEAKPVKREPPPPENDEALLPEDGDESLSENDEEPAGRA